MRLRRIAPLALVLTVAGLGAAWAWDPGGKRAVAERATEVETALSGLEGRDAVDAVKLRMANQGEPPAWVAKTSWKHEENGRTWLLAVGMKANVRNPSLALSAAENKARAELNKLVNGAKVERKVLPNGATSVSVQSSGTVEGAVVLDWYRAPDGTTYALVGVAR